MSPRTFAIILVALVLVAIGVTYARSSGRAYVPVTREFTLQVVQRKVVPGPTLLTARQGDTVVIHITCDEAEELHLHGYDRAIDLAPGVEETLTVVANMSGHFPFELEHSKTELGALEVTP